MESIYFKKQWYEISISMGESGTALRAAIIEYQFAGSEPEATSTISPVFTLIKAEIDRQRDMTRKAEERRSKRKPTKYARLVHRKPSPTQNTNDQTIHIQDQHAETSIDVDKETKRFVKPTVEQIAEYCKEKKYNVDAQRFFAYYESKGWKVGRTPMKSWQAAIITWTKNNFDDTAKKTVFQTADKMNADQVKDYANTTAEAPLW